MTQKSFFTGMMNEKVVCRNFRHTTQHGAIEGKTQSKDVKFYNFDAGRYKPQAARKPLEDDSAELNSGVFDMEKKIVNRTEKLEIER